MVMRRERERDPEPDPGRHRRADPPWGADEPPDEWKAVAEFFRLAHRRGDLSQEVAIRIWVVMCFLNAFVTRLPAPDELETDTDADGDALARVTWEHGPHRFRVAVTPGGLVDFEYHDAAAGDHWGLIGVGGVVMCEDLARRLEAAAGLPPRDPEEESP